MTCRRGGMGSHAFILMHALSTLTSARMMKALRAAQHTRRGHTAHVMFWCAQHQRNRIQWMSTANETH